MARISVKAEIESRKASGNFFRKNVSKTVMQNTLDMVEWLSGEGTKAVRQWLPADAEFNPGQLEGMSYRRVQLLTGRSVQSRFGKSHVFGARRGFPLRGALTKETDGMNPYVQMAVLERQHGMVRRAYNRMRAYERSIRKDMTEGLN